MKEALWRGVTLGQGLPKVIVSAMGASIEEMAKSAKRAKEAGAEIVEIRIDSLSAAPGKDAMLAACQACREVAGQLPLLLTMRTKRDGGAGDADAAAYEALLSAAAQAKVCDAIDVELSVGEKAFMRLVETAHANGVSVVGSSHEFGAIVDVKKAGEWLRTQKALGADVCKAAVMPQSREEAFLLMAEMAKTGETLGVPYAGIVMGEYGVASRVCARAMGSCMTFGAVGTASAPGQVEAGALKAMLRTL